MQDMQKRILFLGTFFIVFFLVVPVLFFSSQQKNTKHPKEIETKEKIPLDHATISKLLQDILKECLPLQTLQADISEDGIVTLSASMTKKDAKKLIQQHNLPLKPALLFLHDPIPLELMFRLESTIDNLSIFLLKFEIEKIDLTELINSQLSDALIRIANTHCKIQSEILSIQTIPGGFSIQFRP